MEKFAELLEKIEHFLVEAEKVYGVYTINNGRKIVIIKNDDGTSRTVSYPKYLMEKELGRQLDPDLETVHHKDGNYFNNDINNLELIPRTEHSTNDTRRVILIKLKCDMCGKDFQRSPRIIRDKARKGVSGSFCNRSCSGRYNRMRQLNQIKDLLPSPEYVSSKYYKRKH